jgi:hypothetical protein
MRIIKIIPTFIIMVFAASLQAQEISVGFRYGFGHYSMNELNNLQDLRKKTVGFPLKTTESFPITPNYRLEFAVNNLRIIDKIALYSAFNSTGARSTLSDYSGRIDLDAVISSYQAGLSLQKNFWKNNHFSTGAYVEGGWIKSKFKTLDFLELYQPANYKYSSKQSFNTQGMTVEPGLALQYTLNPFVFQLNLGYSIDLSGKYFLKDYKEQWLAIENKVIRQQWTGFRIGLQVSYLFKNKKKLFVSSA